MTKIKYIREMSDLHLDADTYLHSIGATDKSANPADWCFMPAKMDEDKETCLVIAGDLWTAGNLYKNKDSDGKTWLEKIGEQFLHVVFILGNHDYWGSRIDKEPPLIREAIKGLGLSNVHFLENESIVIDHIKFIGATLWTDYKDGDPIALHMCKNITKDHQKITAKDGEKYYGVDPRYLYAEHKKSKKFIFDNAIKDNPDQKLVIVTHMAPSYGSVHENYRTASDYWGNFCYFSELGNEIAATEIDFWFHGHMHNPFDYMINNTRVVCNPRGYPVYREITGWDQRLRFEV